MNETSEDVEKLEAFVEDIGLEQLENITNDFNIFNVLRIIKNEVKHSTFLSYILNPQETHGFSDYFLKLFLKNVCKKAKQLGYESPSVVDIDSWDLNEAEVLTEWHSIDLLIKDEENKFVCVIENKSILRSIRISCLDIGN